MTRLWEKLTVRRLAEDDAPRVFRSDDLAAWLASADITPSKRTLFRALQEWEAKGILAKPMQGVYMNMQAKPIPLPEEAISILRPDAVISLASVLGQAGILNNPSYWITAVLPSTATKGPLDIEMPDGRMLRFGYMRPDLVITPNDEAASDALQTGTRVAKATPEKALLDWVYLSSSTRGAARWPLPALHDLDLDDLDINRLNRLADRMDLVEPLTQLFNAMEDEQPRVRIKRKATGEPTPSVEVSPLKKRGPSL